MVAAAKLRRAQEAAEAARPYSERMASVMASLGATVQVGPESPKLLAGTGKDQVHLLVIASSERGLAGGFNTNIARLARKKLDALLAEGKTVKLLFVGKKARAPFMRTHKELIVGYLDQSHIKNVAFSDAQLIANEVTARFEAGEFDVAQPLLQTVEVGAELLDFGLGVELGLGPRPAQPDVDHMDFQRRQLGPAGVFRRL
jgi:F-type H+-transporting ATPase subunit gamma